MRSFEDDSRRAARIKCFLPPRDTKAPFVTLHEAREVVGRHGRAQIIPALCGEFEELVGQYNADGVDTVVAASCPAIAVAEKACHRIAAAALEFGSENVGGHSTFIFAKQKRASPCGLAL